MTSPPPSNADGESDTPGGSADSADSSESRADPLEPGADTARPTATPSTRRRFLAGVAGLAASASLAGCGGNGTPTETTRGASGTGGSTGSLTSSSTDPEPAPAPIGPWPQARADAGNSGYVAASAPTADPSVRWTTRSAGAVGAAVATARDVRNERGDGGGAATDGVYVVAEDGRLAAFDGGSENRWQAAVGRGQFPPAAGSGRVVVPGRGRLDVFDAESGDALRSIEIPGNVLYSPTLIGDRAFVGTFSDGVVAVDVVTGETLWQTGDPSRAYPPLVVDDVAYVVARRWEGGNDDSDGEWESDSAGVFVALDAASGARRWEVGLDGDPTAPPGYRDGVAYAGTNRGRVVAVDADSGDRRFSEVVGDWVTRGPIAAADGIYAVVLGEGLVKLSREGAVQWRSEAGGGTNPTVVGDVAIVGTERGVVAVGRDDGAVRWRGETDAGVDFDVRLAEGGDIAVAGDRFGTVTGFDVDSGDRRWRRSVRPRQMSGPVVGPRTVAGGSRDGGTYDLLGAGGTEFPIAGNAGEPGVTPVFLDGNDLDAEEASGTATDEAADIPTGTTASEMTAGGATYGPDGESGSSETLLGGGDEGSLFRVRTVEYGESPGTDLRPTPTPTATPGPEDPTRTETPHIDFPRPESVWERRLDVTPRSPLTYAGGAAYFGTAEGVAAVDPRDGRLRWRLSFGDVVTGAPAVLGSRAFAATRSGRLVAVELGEDSDAGIDWEVSLDGSVASGPAAVGDAVFVADGAGVVSSYGTDGSERFRRDVGGAIHGGPSVTDERVFVGSETGDVIALDRREGSVDWRSSGTGAVRATPAVGGRDDRTVFVGDHGGTLSAFAAADGDVRFRIQLGRWVDSPPAVGHGAVFVADQTGRVSAVVDE